MYNIRLMVEYTVLYILASVISVLCIMLYAVMCKKFGTGDIFGTEERVISSKHAIISLIIGALMLPLEELVYLGLYCILMPCPTNLPFMVIGISLTAMFVMYCLLRTGHTLFGIIDGRSLVDF